MPRQSDITRRRPRTHAGSHARSGSTEAGIIGESASALERAVEDAAGHDCPRRSRTRRQDRSGARPLAGVGQALLSTSLTTARLTSAEPSIGRDTPQIWARTHHARFWARTVPVLGLSHGQIARWDCPRPDPAHAPTRRSALPRPGLTAARGSGTPAACSQRTAPSNDPVVAPSALVDCVHRWMKGGTILLPRPLLVAAAKAGKSAGDIARAHKVSDEMARYRWNITAVDQQVKSARRSHVRRVLARGRRERDQLCCKVDHAIVRTMESVAGRPVELPVSCSTHPCYTCRMTRRSVAVADPVVGEDEGSPSGSACAICATTPPPSSTRPNAVVSSTSPATARWLPNSSRTEPNLTHAPRPGACSIGSPALPAPDTGWADEHAGAKRAEIEAQGDDTWG